MVQYQSQLFFRSKRCQVRKVDRIIFLEFVIVRLIGKCDGQHALLLQVGFMDTGEGFYKNNFNCQVTGLHGSMFT